MPLVRDPSVVLVDPVLNGAPFKDVCARSGYAVIGLYTLAPACSWRAVIWPARLTVSTAWLSSAATRTPPRRLS